MHLATTLAIHCNFPAGILDSKRTARLTSDHIRLYPIGLMDLQPPHVLAEPV